jgi:hypothetical protein
MNFINLLKKPVVLLLAYASSVLGMSSSSSTGSSLTCVLPPIESLPCYFPSDIQSGALWKLKNSYDEIVYADQFNHNRVAQWAIDNAGRNAQLNPENECSLMICTNRGMVGTEICTSYAKYKKSYLSEIARESHNLKPGWRSTLISVNSPYKEKRELMKELCHPCPPRSDEAVRKRPRDCNPGHL